jgi:hypothetical protein
MPRYAAAEVFETPCQYKIPALSSHDWRLFGKLLFYRENFVGTVNIKRIAFFA